MLSCLTINSLDSMSQFIEMFGGGNWPQKTLGEVGSFTRGGGFQKSDFVEHGIPCIHYGQIHTKFGPFITSHITEISSDLESKTKYASKGDLVIAITSEDTEGSCKSTAWLGDYSVAVGGHAAIYKHSMNPLYMSFFFKSTLFNHAKIEYVHGTKVFEIKPDDIAKILVPCPPMSLQNQFSAIAEQADKSGFDELKSQFIEMTGDPRTNPKGWPVKTLSELATYSIGLTYKPENISEEGTIVLRSGNIQNSKIDLADVVRVNCPIKESIYVQKNDILMCSRNGSAALVGKVAQIKDISEPMTYGAFMTVIRSEYSDFLYLYFQSNDFREQVSTGKSSTMNQITQNMLDKITLPLPDDETRKKLSIILHQADKSGFELRKSVDAIDKVIKSVINEN